MKYLIASSFLLPTLLGSNVLLAQNNDEGCGSGYTQLIGTDLVNALSGKRIIASGDEEWNEDHCSGGSLYKIGDGSAVDPYAYRGEWKASGDEVTYNYKVGGSSSYTFKLYRNDSGDLCWLSGNTVIARSGAPGSAGPCSAP